MSVLARVLEIITLQHTDADMACLHCSERGFIRYNVAWPTEFATTSTLVCGACFRKLTCWRKGVLYIRVTEE